jgi:hypothetical protein
MKYAINKEFFPLYYFSAPVVHPKIAVFFWINVEATQEHIPRR